MPTFFSRSTQHVGLLVATTATAMAFGLVFAVVYALLHRRDVDADPWGRALRLAAAAFTGIWLLPFLRYPANPPGVGDPGTIGLRTNAWLAAIAISLIAVVLAWKIHSHLVARGTSAPLRQLAVAGLLIATLASLFALPDNPDTVDVPAILLWNFRLTVGRRQRSAVGHTGCHLRAAWPQGRATRCRRLPGSGGPVGIERGGRCTRVVPGAVPWRVADLTVRHPPRRYGPPIPRPSTVPYPGHSKRPVLRSPSGLRLTTRTSMAAGHRTLRSGRAQCPGRAGRCRAGAHRK